MSNQFIFFCTNIGNENLLKEEIRVFYPELALSYSRKGFLTFKNKGVHYSKETISQLDVAFATRSGICFGKTTPKDFLLNFETSCKNEGIDPARCAIHSFSVYTNFSFATESILNRVVNEPAPINKPVINVITLSETEIWFGYYKVAKTTTRYPNANPMIKIPELSPSRAYLKIAEAIELFNIKIDKDDQWLDFGSSPGGSSYYFLNEGCKVWGIDPAKMADIIIDNKNYTHVCKSVQDLSQEELPDRKITWVNVELNLNPKQSIKEVLRLCKKYNFSLKGIIFTIQIIKMDHVKNIANFEDHFYEWGFNNILSRQLPSHKQEYVIIARR